MFTEIPLFPEEASVGAREVDILFFFMVAITGLVAFTVTLFLIFFAIRYHRRYEGERTPRILGSLPLEIFWTVVPLLIFLFMFYWGASVYNTAVRPPQDAMEIFVVGKQWMWKVQHPSGQREMNSLHVPVGRPVKLTLTSEDVIHDFFVPVFRTKVDVLPGRYVHTWYLPNKVGKYHLFCSQYCGTDHAGMVGWVHVMERSDYVQWLSESADGSMAQQGRQLFLKMQCITCHSADSNARAPVLEGLYGRTVPLQNGRTVLADEAYIRESILNPRAKIVQGWEPIMPTFQGQLADAEHHLTQEQAIYQLIAFIKSLQRGGTPVRTESFPPPLDVSPIPEGSKQKP